MNGRAGGLDNTDNGRQMSEDWLNENLTAKKTGLTKAEVDKIRAGIETGNTKLVKSEVTGVKPGGDGVPPEGGTVKFYELKQDGTREVTKGDEWTP